MTTDHLLAKLDEIDAQNSRMAGLVLAICLPVIVACIGAMAYAINIF